MLRRLFRGRDPLDDPDPAKRRAAILALGEADAAQRADWLEEHLRSDPDGGVRRACVEKISRATALHAVLHDPELGEAAVRRFIELTPDARAEDPPRVRDARILALPPAEAAALAQSIDDAERLASLALRARGELRAALLALQPLRSASGLTALEKASRDHDKKLNRHARNLLETLKRRRQEADAAYARAEDLAQALLRNAAPGAEKTEQARRAALYQQFVEHLDRYDGLREALQGQGETLTDSAGLRSRTPPVTAAPEPPPEAGDGAHDPAATNPAAQPDPFAELAASFQHLDQALSDPSDFDALRLRRDELTERWLTLADQQRATASQQALFAEVSSRFQALAGAMARLEASSSRAAEPGDAGQPDQKPAAPSPAGVENPRGLQQRARDMDRLIRQVNWPDWAAPPPSYRRLLETRAALEDAARAARASLQDRLAALDRQLDALAAAIDAGSLGDARQSLGEARGALDALPAETATGQQKRLSRLAARLAELKDWQTFATSPKRQTLRDAMQGLADAPLEPRRQAERIKALRAEWQALGPITNQADRQLAEDFNQHAERAFEPCRTFFAAEAERRARNLEERRRICGQLETYLREIDWRQADIRAAERILHTARSEWRSFHPVDRAQGNELSKRFEALQAELHGHLRSAWERNLAEKQAIVSEATALTADGQPPPEAAASVKALQRRWQAVGATPRKADQALWEQFRTACDQVFSALDAERKARQAAFDQRAAGCEEALEAFAAALETTSADTAEAAALGRLKALRQEIGALPAGARQTLLRRHQELVAAYERLLAAQARAALERELETLRRADAAAALPPGGQPPDRDTLRRLAVQAELTAGLPSPAEDEALRLELQVERLQAGFAGEDGLADPLELARTWCDLGAKQADADALRDRFFAALLGTGG